MGEGQYVDHLSFMWEALGLVPSTTEHKTKTPFRTHMEAGEFWLLFRQGLGTYGGGMGW